MKLVGIHTSRWALGRLRRCRRDLGHHRGRGAICGRGAIYDLGHHDRSSILCCLTCGV